MKLNELKRNSKVKRVVLLLLVPRYPGYLLTLLEGVTGSQAGLRHEGNVKEQNKPKPRGAFIHPCCYATKPLSVFFTLTHRNHALLALML